MGTDVNDMKERALAAAISAHNRKRQAELYSGEKPTEASAAKKEKSTPTTSKSRLELLEEQYAEIKRKEENEKKGLVDELKFDGTYSGKEDLGLPKFADSKSTRDKNYRDGLYTKAWSGTDVAERNVGKERKVESFNIKKKEETAGFMQPAKFKPTK